MVGELSLVIKARIARAADSLGLRRDVAGCAIIRDRSLSLGERFERYITRACVNKRGS